MVSHTLCCPRRQNYRVQQLCSSSQSRFGGLMGTTDSGICWARSLSIRRVWLSVPSCAPLVPLSQRAEPCNGCRLFPLAQDPLGGPESEHTCGLGWRDLPWVLLLQGVWWGSGSGKIVAETLL